MCFMIVMIVSRYVPTTTRLSGLSSAGLSDGLPCIMNSWVRYVSSNNDHSHNILYRSRGTTTEQWTMTCSDSEDQANVELNETGLGNRILRALDYNTMTIIGPRRTQSKHYIIVFVYQFQ